MTSGDLSWLFVLNYMSSWRQLWLVVVVVLLVVVVIKKRNVEEFVLLTTAVIMPYELISPSSGFLEMMQG